MGKERRKKGFTLLEVIIAVFVTTIGLIGVVNVINQVIIRTEVLSKRLTAVYLAQEGIEIVRNIRDENWLNGRNFDNGISESEYEADYTSTSLFLSPPGTGRFLYITDGFYTYETLGGEQTPYKRKIIISDLTSGPAGKFTVTVTVSWDDGLSSVSVSEVLHNWFQ